MATTATPYGTKAGYNAGAGVPYDSPPLRYHRAHHCLNFILRVLTALATAAAIITLLKSNETVSVPGGLSGVRARWHDFGALKWFLLANAVVCAYAILAALASLCGICTPRGPLSLTPFAWLTFLVDFLLASALISAAASATTIAWIGYHGQSNAGWNSQCGVVRLFCRRVAGAIIASYCGWVFLALSTLIAASAIHMLRRRAY